MGTPPQAPGYQRRPRRRRLPRWSDVRPLVRMDRAAGVRVTVSLAGDGSGVGRHPVRPLHDHSRPRVGPSTWDGPLIVKGIQSVEDALTMVCAGVDAVVISNRGGRQLDRAPVPLRLLQSREGPNWWRYSIYVDSGVMSGADVIAALALGADAVLVGRAYLYGLMAGGEAGVDRTLDILQAQMRRTMALLGAARLSDLGPQHVTLPVGL